MKFKVSRASVSVYSYEDEIEINSIEELLHYRELVDNPLIISIDCDMAPTIMIYDDYIE